MAQALAEIGAVVVLSPRPRRGAPEPPPDFPARFEFYDPPHFLFWPLRALLAVATGHPLETAYLGVSPDLVRRFRPLAQQTELVVLQLTRLSLLLLQVPGGKPLVVDLIDSLAENFARRAAAGSRLLAPLFRLGAHLHRIAEARSVARAEAVLFVAEGDRAAVAARVGPELATRLAVVPLVAPPVSAELVSPLSEPPRLVVTGNLGYFPTRHGVTGFLSEVWPVLQAERPDLELVLAGARPPRSLRRAARRPGVTLIGNPPDLRRHLAGATLSLAPLEAGTGLPIKVLEAWAEGVPVVAAPAAAAGVGGRDGVDLRIASTPDEWRRTVLELLEDPDQRARLAAAGRARLATDFSQEAVARAYRRVLDPLLTADPRPRSSG